VHPATVFPASVTHLVVLPPAVAHLALLPSAITPHAREREGNRSIKMDERQNSRATYLDYAALKI
jgi:hypothetical protein